MQRNISFNFLGPRIWEIVPDYIKKSNSLEEIILKLYYNYGIQKTVHSGYAKGSYHKSIFYSTTFKFPCSIFYDFCVIFLFCCHTNFKSVLSLFGNFYNTSRQKPRVLAGVVTWIKLRKKFGPTKYP